MDFLALCLSCQYVTVKPNANKINTQNHLCQSVLTYFLDIIYFVLLRVIMGLPDADYQKIARHQILRSNRGI